MPGLPKSSIAAAYLFVLLSTNLYICRDLFFTEFTGHTNSIQGLWISTARLAGEHWLRPSWWPYHDGGMPFEHTYMPLVPGSTAIAAKVMRVSPPRAFNAVTGIFYLFGPLTLFLFAWQMTRAPGYAFWAALAYSLTSPARALIRDPEFHPAFFWTSRRLYTMVVWDDVPHGAAVCFLPLAILFLWLSLTGRKPLHSLLAGVFMALSALASVFGVVAILMSSLCLLFVLPRDRLRSNLTRLLVIGGLVYFVICPFLPPSLIETIRANQQVFPEEQWSLRSLQALSVAGLGWAIVWQILLRATQDRFLRFSALFAYLASCIPLLEVYGGLHFLPQAGRYQPEMELAIPLFAVFALRPVLARLPRSIQGALAFCVLSIAAQQVVSHRRYAKEIVWPVDMTTRIEYRVGQWVDRNLPGQRVMVPGSIAQWFNVFNSTPQLSGGSYSTTPNWTQQEAMISILTGRGPAEAATALLWLKAFGIQAVTVTGPKSREFWKPYADPSKFEGLLPILWREDDVTIYRVPQRTSSLADIVPTASVARAKSDLAKYVTALDDASLPAAEMQWDGFRRIVIHTVAQPDQSLSVQVNYHPGWHARANGRLAAVTRDGLGLLLIAPQCAGPCEVELSYDGGWEYKLCRLLSLLTLLGVFAYAFRPQGIREPRPESDRV